MFNRFHMAIVRNPTGPAIGDQERIVAVRLAYFIKSASQPSRRHSTILDCVAAGNGRLLWLLGTVPATQLGH